MSGKDNVNKNKYVDYDSELKNIANYVLNTSVCSDLAYATARYCLLDTIGCGLLALRFPECAKLLGPVVPNTIVPNGARVPGTQFILDPIKAAWDIGCSIRWLDYNDTWLAAEWGHPSDNLGGILATADYLSRTESTQGKHQILVKDILTAMIKAHEIQGCLALENSFNAVGLDHVLLVRVATSAVITAMLGGDDRQVCNALSLAWVDGSSLRTYRHTPNTGSRKSWAAGDATSRGVQLAFMAMAGEMGYPTALSAPQWGFYDVAFKGQPFRFQREYGSYVMENVLFKISYPAEFHAQTAVEAAIQLHPQVIHRLDKIARIEITTHESAIRIISKSGDLHNPADRDHCLQYITAIGLLHGNLTADDYEDRVAKDPRIEKLRKQMNVLEESRYSLEYHAPDKRSIANAVQVFFNDGQQTDKVEIEYPIGHRRRRQDGMPLLIEKFQNNLATRFPQRRCQEILNLCMDSEKLEHTPINEFMDLFII